MLENTRVESICLHLTVKIFYVTWGEEDKNRVISKAHCYSSDVKFPYRLMLWYIWSPADDNCLGKMWNTLGGRTCWKNVVDPSAFFPLCLCPPTPPLFLPNATMIRPASAHSSIPTIMDCIPFISQKKSPSVRCF